MKKHIVGIRLEESSYLVLCRLGKASGDAPGTIARRLIELALEANLNETLADKEAQVLGVLYDLSSKQDDLHQMILRSERLLRTVEDLNRKIEQHFEKIKKSTF